MAKDEDVCVHCGLCAERCPTAAWDMQKFEVLISLCRDPRVEHLVSHRVNDFAIKLANVNGTGSASANGPADAGDFPHGHSRFPERICSRRISRGCPRGMRFASISDGYTARALDYDLMVAMNAQTYDARYAGSARGRIPALRFELAAGSRRCCGEDIHLIGVPLAQHVQRDVSANRASAF